MLTIINGAEKLPENEWNGRTLKTIKAKLLKFQNSKFSVNLNLIWFIYEVIKIQSNKRETLCSKSEANFLKRNRAQKRVSLVLTYEEEN